MVCATMIPALSVTTLFPAFLSTVIMAILYVKIRSVCADVRALKADINDIRIRSEAGSDRPARF